MNVAETQVDDETSPEHPPLPTHAPDRESARHAQASLPRVTEYSHPTFLATPPATPPTVHRRNRRASRHSTSVVLGVRNNGASARTPFSQAARSTIEGIPLRGADPENGQAEAAKWLHTNPTDMHFCRQDGKQDSPTSASSIVVPLACRTVSRG